MDDGPVPSWYLSPAQVGMVTLLGDGALAPLDGYLTGEQLRTVRAEGHLPDGTAWRGEVTLLVDTATAAAASNAGRLHLRSDDGTLLAELRVSSTDPVQPDSVQVGGPLTLLARPLPLAFADLHRTRSEVAAWSGSNVAISAVQPTTVPDVATLERWRHHIESSGDRLLIQPVLPELPDEAWAATVRAYRRTIDELPPRSALLHLLPLPRDTPATDAATLRAIVAANHGATTMLDAAGVDTEVASSRGLDLRPPHAPAAGPWHPDVQAELARADANTRRGTVVLLTGLSGAGKSTIARALHGRLLETGERSVTLLDGDLVRRTLSSGLGFSAEDRERNVRRIGWVAAEIARHGGVAICAPIAPEDRVRRAVRHDVEATGGRFVLVHVATSLEVCERRDVKGLYAQARAGELSGLTGVDAPYEEPVDAEVVLDTAVVGVDEAVDQLIARIAGTDTPPS